MDGTRREEIIQKAWREIADPLWGTHDGMASQKLGYECHTPDRVKKFVESNFLEEHKRLDSRKPSDAAKLKDAFRRWVFAHTAGVIMHIMQLRSQEPKTIRLRKRKAKGEPLSPEAHARNLEVAWFVVEHCLPVALLVKGQLKYGRHGPYGLPWDLFAQKWRLTHSHRKPYSEKVLPVMYSRAAADSHVAYEVLRKFEQSTTGGLAFLLRDIRQGDTPQATAWTREVRDFFGGHSLADLRRLLNLVADQRAEYIRLHRERQERTQSLPPLSEKYRRSKEYNRALSKQQRTRHLPKSKPPARKG